MKTLTRDEVRRVYDRIGKLQDSQGFYEDPATRLMILHGQFPAAERVFEFGCGTGRLAQLLLSEQLPASASYRAVDLSPTMVRLAQERLAPFGARASVEPSDGGPPVEEPTAAYDRFVSTYVLDLLSNRDIRALLLEAHRILQPGGLLCLVSLSTGDSLASRFVARLWFAVHRLRPSLVGGCRPLELAAWICGRDGLRDAGRASDVNRAPDEDAASGAETVPGASWKLRFCGQVSPFAIPSEVVVAERA